MLLARLVALKTRLTVSRVAKGSVTKLVVNKYFQLVNPAVNFVS